MFDPGTIGTALVIYLGRKVIDHFWSRLKGGSRPIVDQTGQIATTSMTSGRPVVSPTDLHRWQSAAPQQYYPAADPYWPQSQVQSRLEVVGVSVFLPPDAAYLQYQNTVSATLIISAEREEVLLAAVDLAQPFEVDLFPGWYYFYTLTLDPTAVHILDSYTYAVGLPATVNLQNFDTLNLGDMDVLLEMTADGPIYFAPNGSPYMLDMIVLPLDELGVPVSADRRLGTVLGLSG